MDMAVILVFTIFFLPIAGFALLIGMIVLAFRQARRIKHLEEEIDRRRANAMANRAVVMEARRILAGRAPFSQKDV